MASSTSTKVRLRQKDTKPETDRLCGDSRQTQIAQPEFEFGGSCGTLALMIGFPLLMYYMWIGATYYDGQMPLPKDNQSWSEFGHHLINLVKTGAFPHWRAWRIYWTYYLYEAACYVILPGL